MTEHELKYRTGTLGLHGIPDDGPYWRCACGRWRFEAKSMPSRKTGNNSIEARRAFEWHASEVAS